ncbi:MAG: hypothetical protein M9949_13410 [Candidatus Kapabacteria bacterium]|nr:hypothetical protein [Candidatus Kapabacteria bacterium]
MIKIIKIGGISLSNAVLYNELKDLLRRDNEIYFIVISALKNVSSLLKQAAKSAENGNKILFSEIVNEVFSIHNDFIERNLEGKVANFSQILSESKENLMKSLKSVYLTGYLSNRTLDSILSQGELLLLEILKIDLADNTNVEVIDSRSIIKTDSNYNCAKPLQDETNQAIKQLNTASDAKHHITQGFVASDLQGNTTTMGFESSNLTALLIGQALGSKEIRIITDVPGICVADPKIFPDVKVIEEISYDNAYIAAKYGLKLFYAPMIESSDKTDTSIIYSNKINHLNEFTKIVRAAECKKSLIIVREVIRIQTEVDLSKALYSSAALIITDNMSNSIYMDKRNMHIMEGKSLINFNTNCLITVLFSEQSLILNQALKFFTNNEEFKLVIANSDVLHIVSDMESGMEFCKVILPMIS